MRTAGVICECNPPHRGHEFLLRQAREGGADAVVALMSGMFVQRGEPAILEPYARAEMLLSMGADAVLELPFPWSSCGAESFAGTGVFALTRLGLDEIWFGSECADLEKLRRYAGLVMSPAFREAYADLCRSGDRGTAASFADCLKRFCGQDAPIGANDLLAIAYLCAISDQRSPLSPHTVPRRGQDEREREPTDGAIPTASYLRAKLLSGEVGAVVPRLGGNGAEILSRELAAGRAPIAAENASSAILAALRLSDPAALDAVPELSGGLGRHVREAARNAVGFSDLLTRCATKKYPDARIRRGILFSLTGVQKNDLSARPAYLRLLAANETGRRFLAGLRKKSDAIPVITSNAGLPHTKEADRQTELHRRCCAVYSLFFPQPLSECDLLRRSPIVKVDPPESHPDLS